MVPGVQYRQGGHHSPGQHGRGASIAECGALPPSPQTPESSAVLLHRVRLGQATDLHHRHCCAHRAPCVNGCRRHCLSDSWFELSRGDIEHGSHRGPYCSRRLANRIAGLAGASEPLVETLGTSSSENGAASSGTPQNWPTLPPVQDASTIAIRLCELVSLPRTGEDLLDWGGDDDI